MQIVITGASRGIGRAVAERLILNGRAVTAVARDAARLATLNGADVLRWDLREPAGMVRCAWEEFGPFEGLVFAAGVADHQALADVTEAQLTAALDLHVRAPLQLAQDWVARLREDGRTGSAVFLTSTLASRPAPATSVYAASKAALEAFVRTWAQELAPEGIRVNAVAPGVVDTDMVRALRSGPPPADAVALEEAVRAQLADLASLHPLGRLGTPDEVAATVLHALDAAWMTGSVITLDGGLTAG